MVNIKYINKGNKQDGNVCVIFSYGIIIEHYSKGKFKINDVISKFIYFLGVQHKISEMMIGTVIPEKLKASLRQNIIYKEFKNYCKVNNKMRGFELINKLHKGNELETKEYCTIINCKTDKGNPISKKEIDILKNGLKDCGLAMLLYNNGSHSIVVGFDKGKNKYFKRDPNDDNVKYEDFFKGNQITEYIWFSDSEDNQIDMLKKKFN